jgi:AAA+ ATPase superfamily predicted ATPase
MEKRAPFVFGKLATEEAFTNRTEELNYLLQNFQSGINTILISPRRWGKSSLVLKATEKIESRKIRTCSFDMFNTRSQEEFYEQLSQSVISATSGKISEFVENTKEYIGKFIPKINLANEANQEISLSLDWEEIRKDPTDILNLAEKIAARKNIKIIICIDEFQNIGNFEHAVDFQKKLRAAWQRHKHVTYCLYGSKRHMMMDVFTKPSMPFYKFGDLMFLEKIKIQDWKKFIVKQFADTQKKISPELAGKIAELCECHPYYTQQLAQQTWLRTKGTCNLQNILSAHESISQQLSLLFQMITDDLTTTHVNFLKAVIENQQQLSSKKTIDQYRLGTSANVIRIRKALMDKEIIDDMGKGLFLLDPMYAYWLKTVYFRIHPPHPM